MSSDARQARQGRSQKVALGTFYGSAAPTAPERKPSSTAIATVVDLTAEEVAGIRARQAAQVPRPQLNSLTEFPDLPESLSRAAPGASAPLVHMPEEAAVVSSLADTAGTAAGTAAVQVVSANPGQPQGESAAAATQDSFSSLAAPSAAPEQAQPTTLAPSGEASVSASETEAVGNEASSMEKCAAANAVDLQQPCHEVPLSAEDKPAASQAPVLAVAPEHGQKLVPALPHVEPNSKGAVPDTAESVQPTSAAVDPSSSVVRNSEFPVDTITQGDTAAGLPSSSASSSTTSLPAELVTPAACGEMTEGLAAAEPTAADSPGVLATHTARPQSAGLSSSAVKSAATAAATGGWRMMFPDMPSPATSQPGGEAALPIEASESAAVVSLQPQLGGASAPPQAQVTAGHEGLEAGPRLHTQVCCACRRCPRSVLTHSKVMALK